MKKIICMTLVFTLLAASVSEVRADDIGMGVLGAGLGYAFGGKEGAVKGGLIAYGLSRAGRPQQSYNYSGIQPQSYYGRQPSYMSAPPCEGGYFVPGRGCVATYGQQVQYVPVAIPVTVEKTVVREVVREEKPAPQVTLINSGNTITNNFYGEKAPAPAAEKQSAPQMRSRPAKKVVKAARVPVHPKNGY